MADFFRGLSGGFQTGLQLGQAVRERRQRDALAEEAARYGVTEGAFGPELEQNIQQLEGLKAQDPAQAAAYDQAIGELRRRSAMTAPDFTVASRGPTFATRQEAETAARPMRTAGLANVYRQFGDLERADELESRAQAQELTGLQISDARTRARQNEAIEKVNKQTSDWLNKRLTGEDGAVRAPTVEDTVASIQHRAALFQQAGLGDQAAAALQQHASIAANQIQLQTAERTQALSTAALGVSAGNFEAARQFYDQFVPDGAKITSITEDRRTGAITINRAALDGTKLPSTVLRGGRDELIAGMNMLRDPMSLYNYSQRQFENDIKTQTLRAAQARAAEGNFIMTENKDGTLRIIDTSRLPRDASGQPILPEGTRKAGAKDASPMTAQEKQAFDVLKGTDRFKQAVERGETNTIRELLVANNIRPEVYLGATAAPPGGGSWDAAAPAAPAAPAAAPAAPAGPGLARGPSPAALRALSERGINALTPIDTVELAAAQGNQAAIAELARRRASAERVNANTQSFMGGLQ